MLREADVVLAQGKKVSEICRNLGVSGAELLQLAERGRGIEGQPGKAHEGSGSGEQPLEEGGGGFDP